MLDKEIFDSYRVAEQTGGFLELAKRCEVEIQGEDRAKFLHNFCTADINDMQPGTVRELFILDGRGKTLSFGHVSAFADRLSISTAAAGQGGSLIDHLNNYIFREEVELENRTDQLASFYIFGNTPSNLLPFSLPEPNACRNLSYEGIDIEAKTIELDTFGTLLTVDQKNRTPLKQALVDCNFAEIANEVFDIRRIEAGTPVYGQDIDDSNLPQELRRDDKAISFTKGCYLGQETVAKIDAFGHVNKFLVGLKFDEEPVQGVVLRHEDKKVGALKSVVYSIKLNRWLGLGYVKCKLAQAETTLATETSLKCTVIDLPCT